MIGEEEEWRSIREAPRYSVSDCGRVYDYERDCFVRSTPDVGGYLRVKLWIHGMRKSIAVSRLVALAFLNISSLDLEVNHDDGDKTYNHVSNLEWTTRSGNMKHAYENGLSDLPRRISVICVETGVEYKSIRAAARDLSIACHKSISRVLDYPDRSTYGFHFITKEVMPNAS